MHYFYIGDSYSYNLTKGRERFAVDTVTIDDFEEFTEDNIDDIVEYILDNNR